MAIDMGLNKKRAGSKRKTSLVDDIGRPPSKIQSLPDPSAPECRRAWLGCYFLASQYVSFYLFKALAKYMPLTLLPQNISKVCSLGLKWTKSDEFYSLRRESLIKWSPWLENCLQQLENSENALASDKTLCHWVRLQHLVDDVGIHLFVEDPSACRGLDDIGIRFVVKSFDGELDRICTRPLDRHGR